MFRFLHTADWQIGMRARGLGTAGEKVRAARLDALRNAFALAKERNAQAVLVAGDVFEDHQVSGLVVEQVLAVLASATHCPVYVLPGNHDPLTPAGVWSRPAWRPPAHVRVLTTADPVPLAPGVTLYPCPLAAKYGTADPTHVIPPREPGDTGLRIGLAHGTLMLRPDTGLNDFPIPPTAADRLGLDYLALGHWHSTLPNATQRTWYSGTPETTKFGERDSGNALCVTLTEAGAPPTVETVRTGTLTWAEETIDLDADPPDVALQRLRDRPDAARTLLRLRVLGPLTPATAAFVQQARDVLAANLLHAAIDDTDLRTGDPADVVAELAGSPYLLAAAQELGTIDSAEAKRALELLHACAFAARSGA